MSTKCTIGGVPVLALRPVSWALIAGPYPYRTAIELSADDAQRVYRRGADVSFSIKSGGAARAYTAKTVSLEPGNTHQTRFVVIADERENWSKVHIERSYNVRRRTGERRLASLAGAPAETGQIVDDVAFAPYSLRDSEDPEAGGTPWSVTEMLSDVLVELGAEFEVGPTVTARDAGAPLENVFLSGPGDVALSQLLAKIGGVTIFPNADGKGYRVDRTDNRSEVSVLTDCGPPLRLGAYPAVSDRRWQRPKSMRFLFEREHELRLEYDDSDSEPRTKDRYLENVVPVTDLSIEVGDRTLVMGTWVEINEYLVALRDEQPSNVPPLTQEIIRQFAFADQGVLTQVYALSDPSNPAAVWYRRLSAILGNWRRTFRIVPRYMERIASIRASRLALLDDEQGTRAQAQAFAKYTRKPSAGALSHKNPGDDPRIGWIQGEYNSDLNKAIAAPVAISVVDSDQGIVRVEPLPDLIGFSEVAVPAVPATFPDLSGDSGDVSDFDRALVSWTQTKAQSAWPMAMVVTAILGAPNNKSRLYAYDVEPVAAEVYETCSGPVREVRIPSTVMTAWFAWSDDLAEELDAMFAGELDVDGTKAALDTLLVNARAVQELSKATARAIYATMTDRVEGSVVVPFNPSLELRGSITSIEHVVREDGAAFSVILMAPTLDAPSVWAFIPPDVQRQLTRGVQPA